jgi:AcrR family transcriptional regulator
MAARRSSDTYHHGNLRQVLLENAVALARAGGPDAVVLRDVQRRAGVSNSAAYRHYRDRDELIAAVTEYAESRLAETMLARMSEVTNRGPRKHRAVARFRATGQGYVDFALAEPGLFRTAFAPREPADGGQTDSAAVARPDPTARHPFQIVVRCIDDLVATGALSAQRRDGLDEAAWAAVHGLSTLFIDGPLSEADAGRKQMITDRLLDVIAVGIR